MDAMIDAVHGSPEMTDETPTIETRDALGDLMRTLNALPQDTAPMPQRMPADALEEVDLFQVRDGIDGFHVDSLVRALGHDGDLQPVLVIRRGGRAFLVDGRHRKAAYVHAGRGESIPAVEFLGTPQEALLEAQRVNRMHTLGMSTAERMNCAWTLVKLNESGAGRFTLNQIKKTGAGHTRITFMRRVLRELGEAGYAHGSWKDALRAHKNQPNREYSDEEIDAMNEAQAQEIADRLAKMLGTRVADRPKVLARAIEIYTGRRFDELLDVWVVRADADDNDDF